jgi:predicted hotdog family 3-hydroxylacyl-ACP dehydratase
VSDLGPSSLPLVDLLPHRAPMLLLDQVIAYDPHRTTCRATIREDALFLGPDGLVPAWAGLEYMAQCIAVHAGLRARAAGRPPPMGLLIGSRRVDFHVAGFPCGQILHVVAEHIWGETGLASFACRVDDAGTCRVLAEGALKVFAPDDVEAFMAGTPR